MNTPAKRLAKCRQFDCDTQVEQEPLPFGGRTVWVPQLCPACQAVDAKIRSEFAKKARDVETLMRSTPPVAEALTDIEREVSRRQVREVMP